MANKPVVKQEAADEPTNPVVYTAFAPFDYRDWNPKAKQYVMISVKSGDVFTLPDGWTEIASNDPGNNGVKFSYPGDEIYNDKGELVETTYRAMILPLNKG